MALDGRPVWLSADPLAAPVRITTDVPYGGMPVRFVTPGGLHEAQAVRMDAGWQSAPIWDAGEGGAPTYSGWTPSDGGLSATTSLWFDGADSASVTHASGVISQWSDKSGQVLHLTPSATREPAYVTAVQNGRSIIRFDGNDNLRRTTLGGLVPRQGQTTFVVAKATNATTGNLYWTTNGSTVAGVVTLSTGSLSTRYQGNTNNWAQATIGTAAWHVYSGYIALTARQLFVDGTDTNTNSTAETLAVAPTAIWFGSDSNPLTFFAGDLGEFIQYPLVLSAAERQHVEGYLAWKWGLQALLVAGHPWIAGAPPAGAYVPPVSTVITDHLAVTRASVGYAQTVVGTLTSFAANTLRVTDKGLLIEEARTNDQLYSQQLDGANWTLTNATLTANTTVSPDGTTTADTLTDNTSLAFHRIYPFISIPAGTITVSVYAKAGTLNWIQLMASGQDRWANFNLSTGLIGNKHASATARIETLASGWYRCSVTYTQGSTGASGPEVRTMDSDLATSNPAYTGTGTGTVHLWGVQCETGDYATSYIPTTTVAATRAADAVTFIGSSDTLLDGSGATVVASMDGIPKLLQADLVHGSSGSMTLYKSAPTVLDLASATGAAQKTGLASHITAAKYGAAWTAAGGKSLAGQGVAAVTATGAVAPLGTVYVGSNGTVNHVNTYVRSLKLWNTRLSDANLVLETGAGSAVPPTINLDFTA